MVGYVACVSCISFSIYGAFPEVQAARSIGTTNNRIKPVFSIVLPEGLEIITEGIQY